MISKNYFVYLLSGYIFISYFNHSFQAGIRLLRDRRESQMFIYESSLPLQPSLLALSRIIGSMIGGTIGFGIFLLLMLLVVPLSLTSIIVYFFSGICLGLLLSALSIILTKIFGYNQGIFLGTTFFMTTFLMFFSPLFYQLETVPTVMKMFFWLNPFTWVLELARTQLASDFVSTTLNGTLVVVLSMILLITTLSLTVMAEKIVKKMYLS
jgi:ABC-type polysaccharide/polyol phosphate export permease